MEIISIIISSVTLLLLGHYIYKQQKTTQTRKTKILVDTSGIIDARIFDVAATGFITGELIIPKFVLAELQHVADTGDSTARARAREGMEKLRLLQNSSIVSVSLSKHTIADAREVDEGLLQLAKRTGARLYTTDFNLIKRAQVEGVETLNVNDLAHSVRVVVLPGEHIRLKLIQKGSDKGQAVGYLEDGTMVVVDRASGRIGKEVDVVIQRVIQTAAGKMFFATLKDTKS